MADNTVLPVGSGGDTIRDLDKGGAKTQVLVVDVGGSGVEKLVNSNSAGAIVPFPVGGIRRDADTAYGADLTDHPLLFNATGRLKVSVAPADTAATSGSITTNGQIVFSDISRASNLSISMIGTSLVGHNAAFEVSNDSTNGTNGQWYVAQVTRSNSSAIETSTGVLAATPVYAWTLNASEYRMFRVRATAHTSGTAAYLIQPSAFSSEPIPSVSLAASSNTIGTVVVSSISANTPTLATGTNNVGGIVVRNVATTNGYTRTRFTAAAGLNATVLKASSGTLVRYRLVNVNAAAVYLKFSNATAVTPGTTPVAFTIRLPAGSNISEDFIEGGEFFSTGVSFCMSTVLSDADTTGNLAASDVYGFFTFI